MGRPLPNETFQLHVKGALKDIDFLLSEGDYGEGAFEGSSNAAGIQKLTRDLQGLINGNVDGKFDEGGEDPAATLGGSHGNMNAPTTQEQQQQQDRRAVVVSLLEDCFANCDQRYQREEEDRQFEITERFLLEEQASGAKRRGQSRGVEAKGELRMAAEIATLKGFRQSTRAAQVQQELQNQLGNVERAYLNRKLVVSKAARIASSECRTQFARVRTFFDDLHATKQKALEREHQRDKRRLELLHRLKGADQRVRALELQIADRVYHKKLQDLQKEHIAQNMEEAMYMESMLELLEQVQQGRETAATDIFQLHVQQLKERQAANERRTQEANEFSANATVEIAKVVGKYIHEDKETDETFQKQGEHVDAMERRKDYYTADAVTGKRVSTRDSKGPKKLSVSDLYDTVLWSVVKDHACLTSSSSDFSSDIDDELEEEEQQQQQWRQEQREKKQGGNGSTCGDGDLVEDPETVDCDDPANSRNDDQANNSSCHHSSRNNHIHHNLEYSDGGSTTWGGSTCGSVGGESTTTATTAGRKSNELSPPGHMHVKQITRELRIQERALLKRHQNEAKRERKLHRIVVRDLKRKHQHIVDGLVEACLIERQNYREGIDQRMASLKAQQETSTEELRDMIKRDFAVLQTAMQAEDKRVQAAEAESFSKAQAVISAQVFHEVRNALSSVIAMSEIATDMKRDQDVSPKQLVASVEDMFDQIKEVIDYALRMLNNVLDISKIASGSFEVGTEAFDLSDLVARATKMQMAKSGRIKMKFNPLMTEPCIAISDSDIVVRIVTNLISNAIKFTGAGGVQPFVCPLEDIVPEGETTGTDDDSADSDKKLSLLLRQGSDDISLDNAKKKLVAVGVADTGCGLSRRKLKDAITALSQCDVNGINSHGVRNSGFGLHLSHLLAKGIGSSLELTSLAKCTRILNHDMLDALHVRERLKAKDEREDNLEPIAIPGRGTVLYITLPVYEDGEGAKKAIDEREVLQKAPSHVPSCLEFFSSYTFLPRPAPNVVPSTFRIMVADDVMMLRKGLVHVMSSIFQDCPVSISTACTAEDLLRAVSQNHYDLIICDNLFHHDASKLRELCLDEDCHYRRPSIVLNNQVRSKQELRDVMASYFSEEAFTMEEGDGEMTGFEALRKLATRVEPGFSKPVLMLVSGHKIEAPPELGIIVTQKPMKQNQFTDLLQRNIPRLIHERVLMEEVSCMSGSVSDTASLSSESAGPSGGSTTSECMLSVVNGHGAQFFIRQC